MIKFIQAAQTAHFRKISEHNPTDGDTFISQDGNILVFILDSSRIVFLDSSSRTQRLHPSRAVDFQGLYQRCNVNITVEVL